MSRPFRGCFLIRCKSFEARWFLLKNGVIRLLATRRGISDRSCFMNSLPMTGTAALLEELSPFLPDTQINAWFERRRGPGRPGHFSPAQLLRVLLLVLLTPAHSFNLLVALLPEQRTWRHFARLPNRRTLPDAKMLHAFREQLSLTCLRQLNAQLLQPLLTGLCATDKTVALIDATDLPAATNTYKKTRRVTTRRGARRWAGAA